jgi:uncharacterized protein (DUF849 family)
VPNCTKKPRFFASNSGISRVFVSIVLFNFFKTMANRRVASTFVLAAASAAAIAARPKKALVTAALNGVLTDPAKFSIPVTPAEMAAEAKRALVSAWCFFPSFPFQTNKNTNLPHRYDAGATVVHIHLRDQRPGQGHLPSWDPDVAADVCDAIRSSSPVLVNFTTGTMGTSGPLGGGPLGPTDGPIACLERARPAMAALNAGSLNYLRTTQRNDWAWQPLLFDNPVAKIAAMATAMARLGIVPECECFDTGIVRSVAMFEQVGLLRRPYQVSFVMGVASGMPADPAWLPLLTKQLNSGAAPCFHKAQGIEPLMMCASGVFFFFRCPLADDCHWAAYRGVASVTRNSSTGWQCTNWFRRHILSPGRDASHQQVCARLWWEISMH